MTKDKKNWLYYLLEFQFIKNDQNLYQYIRDLLYRGKNFDDVDLYMIIQNKKPLSDNSEIYSMVQWVRDFKIDQIIN